MKKQSHSYWRLSHVQEHLAAFVIATLFVWGVIGIVVYRDALFADITGASQSAINTNPTTSQLPLVYKITDGSLQIITTKMFKDVKSMTFFVVFDPKNVLLQLEKANSLYQYTYAPGMETMVQITLMIKNTIPENTVIYTLPVNGSIENVTIANAGILWQDDVFETLAIQKK